MALFKPEGDPLISGSISEEESELVDEEEEGRETLRCVPPILLITSSFPPGALCKILPPELGNGLALFVL